jgi:hypothetical protein
VVEHGIAPGAPAICPRFHPARLAEINIAGEFAHDHDVQTGDHLAFQGGCLRQRLKTQGGTQISE